MNRTTCGFAGWLVVVALIGLAWPAEAQAGKTLLRLRVDGPMREAAMSGSDIQALFAYEPTPTLHEWVTAVRQAAADRDIAGLALIIEQPELSMAQVEEMARAVREFRAKGKPVYCYADYVGNVGYVLASAADHITLAENSELGVVGIYAEAMYLKGLLDKLGIEMDGMQCGAYKGATEPFTRTEPSEEVAANLNWLLDGLYERWIGMVAEGRGLSVDEVKRLVDRAPLTAEEALEHRLVDEVSSFDAFSQRIRKEFGEDAKIRKEYRQGVSDEIDWQNPFAMFELFSKVMEGVSEPDEPGIGLIVVEGTIMVGESEASPLGGLTAGSTTIRAALERALADDKIKAVVLRVDSPGGSALASDIIWKAAARFGRAKPLIVSMGSVAASGGYYVATPGDTVFAEATTVTGSIGVAGGKFVWRELMEEKLGITTTAFARGDNAGLGSMNSRWTEHERALVQKLMDRVYDQFKGRIKEARGNRLRGDLESMAGGRVFTGAQAVERGLVDEIGGLSEALAAARKKASLGRDCPVYVLPKPSELAQLFAMLEKLTGGQGEEDEFEIRLALRSDPWLASALAVLRELAPDQMQLVQQGLNNLLIVQRERVGCFMPVMLRVR